MKYKSLLKVVLFGFICAFIATSCVKEGPMGPAGADGANGTNGSDGRDGVDGQVTCLVCHSGTNMDSKKAEFAMSEHSVGAIAVSYAGGRASCARCHSHQGFVQYAVFGEVLGDITNPSPWECSTCHGLHKTFEGKDFALRLTDPVKAYYDKTGATILDMKNNSNLCINCHQARTLEPGKASPGETFKITSTHYGPHHGPQGNMLAGVGFAEIPGSVAYPAPGSNFHLVKDGKANACTGCHMGNFDKASKTGGHSWIPNLSRCIECHNTDMKNYDYGGKQSSTEELLVQLRDKLIELGVVTGNETDGYHPVTGTYPMIQAQAYYNYIGIEEDRSLGAHNPKYITALLLNTIEALQ